MLCIKRCYHYILIVLKVLRGVPESRTLELYDAFLLNHDALMFWAEQGGEQKKSTNTTTYTKTQPFALRGH
jgi:hypothetical protein